VGLARIRRDGFYLSLGELEPSVGGAAVPLLSTDGDVLAALTLVGTCERLQTVGAPRLKVLLQKAAVQIRERLA
jgi:DNA-binding IclR family transcriptional regulator